MSLYAWTRLAAVAGLCFIVSRVWAWYRLRHIKGPPAAAWTSLWLVYKTRSGQLFYDLASICNQYGMLHTSCCVPLRISCPTARYRANQATPTGPIARIAPNIVVCGDAGEVRRMWGVRSQFDRALWYKGFQLDPPRDCTLSIRDNDAHAVLRSKLVPGYSGKDVPGLHKSVDRGVARFIRLIEDKYLSSHSVYRPVDLARKFQYMTLDIISSIAFGEPFGFMDEDDDKFGYIQTTEDTVPMMQMFAIVPWLVALLQSPICKAMMPSETDTVGLGPIMAIAKRIVGERYGPAAIERRDMLGSFVSHGLDQRDAESESLVQILAGSDTTATALRTIVVNVVTNRRIFTHLQREIDDGIAGGLISSPIAEAEARKLPFLQACIKEGFRIWPPITGIMPRISATDATLCGVHIPSGTNVAWSAKAVLHSTDVFGSDADIYWPDRWLTADRERLQVMENTVDLCFGQGRWGCLGRSIALLELNKIIVELLRRFDFSIVNAERPIKNAFTGVLIQSQLYMRVSRRPG
ncbi:hypothetical protein QQS21_000114 [Conoideocrella luteorostrata]|uniref:Cytochrome P450 n=1 Tax=Conoideocrella luteorostrata TaxID=1105319 RepID=A0AAJ0CZM2_9HYPO|nr:hypothetical protein QQS21_000114 [Conoideocrella luteorostrata]